MPILAFSSWLLFGSPFIELLFIMSDCQYLHGTSLQRIWFLFLVLILLVVFFFFLLVVVCAEVSLVLTYMHLCVEDWK